MTFEEIALIITFVPAVAWFIGSFYKIYKLYEANEDKIKTVTKDAKEQIQEGAVKVKQAVEEKIQTHNPKQDNGTSGT